MQNTTDEQTLVDRLKHRDPAAFKILLQIYKNKVANICYRFLFNREDAEEIAQEVFIDIYRGITSFRGDSKLSTWIYQLSTSKCIDLIRSRKRKKRAGHVMSLLGMQDEGREIPDPRADDPVKNLENEEKGRIIREAIDTLPIKYRRVFTLSKCEGFSNKEVAEIMGLTQSSVESVVHRANKKLRKILYSAFEKELQKESKKVQSIPGDNVTNNGKIFFIICCLIFFSE
ncbi:MAG: RNA polymerase sigma factor [bacterium]|nr:RNA polymerase sigma factor [bacterium]